MEKCITFWVNGFNRTLVSLVYICQSLDNPKMRKTNLNDYGFCEIFFLTTPCICQKRGLWHDYGYSSSFVIIIFYIFFKKVISSLDRPPLYIHADISNISSISNKFNWIFLLVMNKWILLKHFCIHIGFWGHFRVKFMYFCFILRPLIMKVLAVHVCIFCRRPTCGYFWLCGDPKKQNGNRLLQRNHQQLPKHAEMTSVHVSWEQKGNRPKITNQNDYLAVCLLGMLIYLSLQRPLSFQSIFGGSANCKTGSQNPSPLRPSTVTHGSHTGTHGTF